MRALVIASMLALPLAAPAGAASPSAEAGEIKGNMKLPGYGCRGVKLIPRTAESEREILAMFGTTRPAAKRITVVPFEQARVDRGASLGREVTCAGWTQSFRFKRVAPGEYFITALAVGGADQTQGSGNIFGEPLAARDVKFRRLYVMQPVRVTAADRIVKLNFTQD